MTKQRKSKASKSIEKKVRPAPFARCLQVEYRTLDLLKPFERNARTHKATQVDQIAESITSFGFTNPILVSEDGEIIAGHGRYAAAQELELQTVPVIVLDGLSDAQRRQLVLADNRIALNAGWDLELLRVELRDLADMGADLKVLGFTAAELSVALTGDPASGLVDEDDTPEVQEQVVSRPGDVWLMGPHRLICGDSTNAEVVQHLLGDDCPALMVTDPPYGVEYDPGWRHAMGISHSRRQGKVLNDERADWREAWALFPGRIAYVWHGALHAPTVADSLTGEGFAIRAQIIWAKTRLVIGRGDYHWQHEPCWYGVRGKGNWLGDRKQTTLWTIATQGDEAEDAGTVHGTQKPVECMRRPIVNHVELGGLVYEPFMGSGTTLIAAESVSRVCRGIELNPAYVDVAVRRWEAFTGRCATIAGSSQTFADVATARSLPDLTASDAPAAAPAFS